MKNLLLLLLTVVATGRAYAAAEIEGQSATSLAVEKPWGTYVSIGNPYPSLLGINAAYGFASNWRASIGYGEIEATSSIELTQNGITTQKVKAQTYGAGAEYLITDGRFRPLVGVHGGYFNISGKGDITIQGLHKSTGLLYSNLGIDWLTGSGINLGSGINVAMIGGSGANFYANVGYFF